MPDEALLVQTLVELADSLIEDFDVVELLCLLADRCVEVLSVSAAGVMLAAPEGDLRVVASSSEAMRVLEVFELQSREGPCLDCYASGEAVLNQRLAADGRWPRFGPAAVEAGFRSAHALPMRLRGAVIGALNLFGSGDRDLSEADLSAGQALAAVATIAILQQRVVSEARLINDQLNTALTSRVLIEQAKGVLAERAGLTMPAAFEAMRKYSRDNNLRLADVAGHVIDKTLAPDVISLAPAATLKSTHSSIDLTEPV